MGLGTKNAAARESPDALLGVVLDERFHVLSVLARGGMGTVYVARQEPLGREVALKILDPRFDHQLEAQAEFDKRFFLEASACSKLRSAHTITVFDYGQAQGRYYIAMELLDGKTLHRTIRQDAPLPPERVVTIASQVCRSLREAHTEGLVHRDLKPANIFLVKQADDEDFVKVLDFGLVKNVISPGEDITKADLFMGSPKYMSPEQIKGERPDGRADVYALGAVMFEMLTGKAPFDYKAQVDILVAHLGEPVPSLSSVDGVEVPPALDQIVRKCLEKSRDDRFASMDELLLHLKRYAVSEQVPGLLHSGAAIALPPEEWPEVTPTHLTPSAIRPAEASEEPTRDLPSPEVVIQDDTLQWSSEDGPDAPDVAERWDEVDSNARDQDSATQVIAEQRARGAHGGERGTSPWMISLGICLLALLAALTTLAWPRLVELVGGGAASETIIVSVQSDPPGARVFLHDQDLGVTPLDLELGSTFFDKALPLRFSKEGFRDRTLLQHVSRSAGTLRLDTELQPQP